MKDHSLQLQGVTTLPSGTLLEYSDGGRDTVYFYDANNDLKLDAGDKKAVETPTGENTVRIKTESVSQKDIRRFGAEMEKVFLQARKEREELSRVLPSSRTGQCFFPMQGQTAMTVQGVTFRFQPPLSIHTVRTSQDKLYSLLDLINLQNDSIIDPARCFSAHAVSPLNAILGWGLDGKELELSSGNLMGFPVFAALGIKNGENLDVSYQLLRGLQKVHIDLSPLPSP